MCLRYAPLGHALKHLEVEPLVLTLWRICLALSYLNLKVLQVGVSIRSKLTILCVRLERLWLSAVYVVALLSLSLILMIPLCVRLSQGSGGSMRDSVLWRTIQYPIKKGLLWKSSLQSGFLYMKASLVKEVSSIVRRQSVKLRKTAGVIATKVTVYLTVHLRQNKR